MLAAVCVAVAAGGIITVRATGRGVSVTSASMENTLRPGDTLIADPSAPVHRGDIVVVDENSPPQVGTYVRRVIGLPGDHVVCCDAGGRVTVNGKPLDETYLYPGDKPSPATFNAVVPSGEYWLMGDHRGIAYDSASSGPLPAKILGTAVLIVRSGHFTTVRTPETFVADGLAPPASGTTPPVLVALGVTALAFAALILLAIYGTVSWAVRRRRRKSAPVRPDYPGA